ncbi:tail fiber domain-containing protein [Candidatus Margulisiibacteriota bacterium]
MLRKIMLMVIGVCLVGGMAWADVPTIINFQGRIDPEPRAGTTVTFSLKSDRARSIGWSEDWTVEELNFKQGMFSVDLGSKNGTLLDFITDSKQLDVQMIITVGGTELGRHAMTSVPYAMMAQSLPGVTVEAGNLYVRGDVVSGGDLQVGGNIIGAGDLQVAGQISGETMYVNNTLQVGGDILNAEGDSIAGSGLWTQAENGSDIYYSGGNVGVRTDMPKEELHVVGDYYGEGGILLKGSGGIARIEAGNRDIETAANISLQFGTCNTGTTRPVMTLAPSGNVGIGIDPNDKYKLRVGDLTDMALIGPAVIGEYVPGTTDGRYAFFGHYKSAETAEKQATNYALLQHSDGMTYLNAAPGKSIYLRAGGQELIDINPSGYELYVRGDINFTGDIYDSGIKLPLWSRYPGGTEGTAGLYTPERVAIGFEYPKSYAGLYVEVGTEKSGIVVRNSAGEGFAALDAINDLTGANASLGYNDYAINSSAGKNYLQGSVGIGIKQPGQKLHVNSTGAKTYLKVTSTANASGSYFGADEGDTVIQNKDAAGQIEWHAGGSRKMYLTPAGDLYTPSGSVSSLDLASISSRRYKENIRPFRDDFWKILKLEPKAFTWKTNGKETIGYIAEDVDQAGLKDLVLYNESGQPDALSYNKMSVYLLEVVKELKAGVDELKAENASLKDQVRALQAK